MRRFVRILALLLAVGAIAAWFTMGANRGWTKTSVTEMKVDEITELEYPVTTKKFVPGVDLLAAGVGVSVFLLAASFLIPKPKR